MARLDDIAIAKTLCDYFVGRRVYGQGLDTNTQAGLALYQRGGRLSTALTLSECCCAENGKSTSVLGAYRRSSAART